MLLKLSTSFFALFLCLSIISIAQTPNDQYVSYERESTYGSPDDTSLPDWVRAMYAPDPNLPEVVRLYQVYYKNHPFEKNQHTQYFKRWVKASRPFVNAEGFIRPPSKQAFDAQWAGLEALRLTQGQEVQQRGPTDWGVANWTGIGPFDFDKDAAGRSHAPGAAHVYTLEKAPSNPDILYCGTATAGVWKTTDRGLHWTCVTHEMPLNYCNAVEIHPTNPDIALFGGNNRLYKTTDGGVNWTEIGDAAFNNVTHDIREIAFQPGNPNVLFVGSNRGFYRSVDGGASFTKIIGVQAEGYFSEIEFKPDDPNTMFVLQSEVQDLYTELYKSTDGGVTFTIMSGWPVLSAAATTTNQYIHRPGSGTNYAGFNNDQLGSAAIPNFTIEMRVKFPAVTIYDKSILSNKNWASGTNKGWVLAARYTGQLTFNMGTGAARIDLNTGGIWDDAWHHITVVYRANGLKSLYKDGVLAATSTTDIGTDVATALPMILGYDGNIGYGGQEMSVDEIRIFNTVLTPATIANWKNTEADNTHPNYANLLHHYKCNELAGSTLTDATGTNNGTISGAFNRLQDQFHSSSTLLAQGDNQKRAEIAVTAANPDRVYALLAGEADGGEGLYGVYVSNDAGVTWTHKCCGSGPGGPAIGTQTVGLTSPETNANMLGYSESGSSEGGQYYYDLAMEADPGNADKVHIAGINHWYSVDGGTTFQLTAKWSWPEDPKYVHADIHDIQIYGNEVWISCDGGIFMSPDSGKLSFNQRQYGIQGTDFWGFGMGHKDANVMLGGTYHNSHLMKNNNVYLNGWVSYTGSADGTRGFVNPGKPTTVYNDSGKDQLSNDRTVGPIRTNFSKLPNTGGTPSKITWDPRCYNCLYTGNQADLWYSEDDGNNFTLLRNFGDMNVADIEVAWDDPNTIYVGTDGGFYDPKGLWKTNDRGQTWTEITPSAAQLGFQSSMSFDVAIGANSNELWLACFHPYGWYDENNNKIFYSEDGGATWTNWGTTTTNGQSISNILYQRGSNGGVYLGTRSTVLYRNHDLSDWVIFDKGLPGSMYSQAILPWYKEGKIRSAGNRSVWESPMYELGQPVAQPMADKRVSYCARDTVYFADYSAQYKTGAAWQWNITPAPAYISSATVENPKVVFGASGAYNVSLTVSDSMGSHTRPLYEGIVVSSGCEPDTITGNALQITANGQYAAATEATKLNTNQVTMMAWVKPGVTHTGTSGVLFFRGGTTTSGIHLENNNRLAYHWNDGFYNYNSNLFLPVGEWSHIAMVVEPDKTTLYLNGKAAVSSGTHPVEAFDAPFNIGRDPTSSARTFKGLIDEVCLYKRSLTQTEIREQMHFVKRPSDDPDLVSYYQFNENGGADVLDRAGLFHARITSAGRIPSTAPFATGVVARTSVSTGGGVEFGNTGLNITFPAAGNKPNGELVVSRLYRRPDVLPSANASSPHYWIVNNYGTNSSFAALENITFRNIGSTVANDNISLHKRRTGQDGATWGSPVANYTTQVSSSQTDVTFPGNNITGFSQFNISAQNSALPVEWLSFQLRTSAAPAMVQLFWQTAQEQNTVYFEVERSREPHQFEKIGRVTAEGNSAVVNTYNYTDTKPLSGVSYYRIKQVDNDGKFTFSEIRVANLRPLHDAFSIAPNLLKSGQPIQISTDLEGYTAGACDAWGRILFEQTLSPGSNTIATDGLPSGTYFIHIANGRDACLKKVVVE